MRLIIVLLMVLPLSGCFFFYIPGSTIDAIGDSLSGDRGNTCVASGAYVGQRIIMPDGRTGTLIKVEGESRRCNNPALPLRAIVDFPA